MTWNTNYRNMVNKANRILGLLQRNVHHCSQSTKAKAYKALVRPHLEYAAAVTDPHQTNHIQMLDRVQRRAARFVVNDYRRTSSVTEMLNNLEWESLSDRRQTARLCQFYQIHHGCPLFRRVNFSSVKPSFQAGTSLPMPMTKLRQELSDSRTLFFRAPLLTGTSYH